MEIRKIRAKSGVIIFFLCYFLNYNISTQEVPSKIDKFGRRLIDFNILKNKELVANLFKENSSFQEIFLAINNTINNGVVTKSLKKDYAEYNIINDNIDIYIILTYQNNKPSLKFYKDDDKPLVYGLIIVNINKIKKYEIVLHCVKKANESDIVLREYSIDNTDWPKTFIEYYYKK